ncbi:MAG TPA: NAD(P)H-hydrate epimerase [Candidatus Acidoferrum sp.]|nr:NAD(P)H-hydrate epimerase [Candidatus Acidoferrum sp.]
MPTNYYTAQAVRELDRLAIEQYGIPGFTLMQRAGKAAFDALCKRWPNLKQLIVCCGTGNNGGDGFVIAALAQQTGLRVEVYLVGQLASIKGNAARALDLAKSWQVPIHESAEFPGEFTKNDTVVVDALLGTGLKGEVRSPYRTMIEAINRSGLPVLAVDIPSGLCSDTGVVLGSCVKAAMTVTFIGHKLGLVSGAGPALAGEVVFDTLQVPPEIYRKVAPVRVE